MRGWRNGETHCLEVAAPVRAWRFESSPAHQVKIKPIWISSVEHLNKFAEIANGSNFFQKLVGYYKIPAGFPFVRLMLVLKLPVVFFSSAEINIEESKILFTPSGFKTLAGRYENMQPIQFELNRQDIQSIERYEAPPVLMQYYSINWVRIKTKSGILGGDFLLCVGGEGPLMEQIQDSTDALYRELVKFYKKP